MGRINATRFPLPPGRAILLPIEEVFDMHAQQLTAPAAPFKPLQIAAAAWNLSIGRLRDWRAARSQERAIARLPPHLLQDIGTLDCRPPAPPPLAETLRSRHQTLEGIWLDHGGGDR